MATDSAVLDTCSTVTADVTVTGALVPGRYSDEMITTSERMFYRGSNMTVTIPIQYGWASGRSESSWITSYDSITLSNKGISLRGTKKAYSSADNYYFTTSSKWDYLRNSFEWVTESTTAYADIQTIDTDVVANISYNIIQNTPINRVKDIINRNLSNDMQARNSSLMSHNDKPAELRARRLLRDIIGDVEFKKYLQRGFIMVQGRSGLQYKVSTNGVISYAKGADGKLAPFEYFCIVFKDSNLPPTDAVVMRKLLIETDEFGFRKASNISKTSQAGRHQQRKIIVGGIAKIAEEKKRPDDVIPEGQNLFSVHNTNDTTSNVRIA